jgi:hypothetical protein
MRKVPEKLLQLPIYVREEMAMKQALAKVLADHKRRGVPLAVSRNGKVVWMTAEELEAEQLNAASAEPLSSPLNGASD